MLKAIFHRILFGWCAENGQKGCACATEVLSIGAAGLYETEKSGKRYLLSG